MRRHPAWEGSAGGRPGNVSRDFAALDRHSRHRHALILRRPVCSAGVLPGKWTGRAVPPSLTPPGRVPVLYPCCTMPNRDREHWHLFRLELAQPVTHSCLAAHKSQQRRPARGKAGGDFLGPGGLVDPRDRLRCREPGRAGQSVSRRRRHTRPAFAPLATKLDISTANAVDVPIGLSGGDCGRFGRGRSRNPARSAEAPRTTTGGAFPFTSVTPNDPPALSR